MQAKAQVDGEVIHIEAGPLPDALPQYMSDGQCTPERMQADADTLAALTQVTAWRRRGDLIVLLGPMTLTFRPSDHWAAAATKKGGPRAALCICL